MLGAICGHCLQLCYGGIKKDVTVCIIIAFAITLLTIFWQFHSAFEKLRTNGKAHLPPGPHGLPLVGYLPFLGTNVHQTFMELAKVYGPIYKLWLGNKLCFVVSSSSLIKEIVRDQDITFANRGPTIASLAFSYGGNDIAFAPYGHNWRMLRKIFVHEMLSNENLDAFYPLRRQEVKKSIRDLYGKIDKPIHIGELAFTTVINIITSMLWGGTIEGENGTSIGAEFRAAASQLTVVLGKPNVSDFFPVIARFDIQGVEREMKKILQRIEQIFDGIIEQLMKMDMGKGEGIKMNRRKDFLQFLVELKDREDTQGSITLAQIKALLMDIVVGGTDTTMTMVEWVMAEMMRHPEVMDKAHQELTNVVGNSNVVEEFHIHKLTYLHAVVKETLRLHPAAPLLLPRCPNQSCILGGYTIPKGTKVFLNVWAMHRDPHIWDNPLEFQPERFLNDTIKLDYYGNSYHYLPFGSGKRICAGLPLAKIMLMYVLASFLHSFEWKLPDGIEPNVSEKFGVVLEKSTPLIAIPKPRFSNLELYT